MTKTAAFKELDKLTGGDAGVMKELLTIFIRENLLRINTIKACQDSKNWKELKRTAHKIKSSFALIGMMQHRALAEELEQVAGDDRVCTDKLIVKLLKACQEAIDHVQKKLKEIS